MATEPEEQQFQKDLFEKYLYLLHAGKNKTEAIKGVAKDAGYSESALWNWKKKFNWDAREIIRSKEINELTQQRNNETITDMKVKYMGDLETIADKFMDALRGGIIPIEKVSVTEFIRLVETYLKIGGEDLDKFRGELEVKGNASEIPEEVAKEFGNLLIQRSRDRTEDRIPPEESKDSS